MPVLNPCAEPAVAVRVVALPAAVGVDPDVATVAITGDLDLLAVDHVTAAFEDVLALGHRVVRVDVSRVTFLDCAGLAVLVLLRDRFLAAGGSLVLIGVGRQSARLLRLAGLQDVLCSGAAPAGPRP